MTRQEQNVITDMKLAIRRLDVADELLAGIFTPNSTTRTKIRIATVELEKQTRDALARLVIG